MVRSSVPLGASSCHIGAYKVVKVGRGAHRAVLSSRGCGSRGGLGFLGQVGHGQQTIDVVVRAGRDEPRTGDGLGADRSDAIKKALEPNVCDLTITLPALGAVSQSFLQNASLSIAHLLRQSEARRNRERDHMWHVLTTET